MPQIHPTAILGPDVRLADDVVVGPGCIFEGAITIGPGCSFKAACYLQGPLTMGARNACYPAVTVGYPPQDRSYPPDKPGTGVVIGDDNVFREMVTIHRATRDAPTRIGSHNYFMVGSHAAHDTHVGSHCTLANGAMLGGHVHLGDRVTLGGSGGVHQFCSIGRLVMVAGAIAVTQDVPPFCTVFHNRRIGALNRVGLRRNGLRDAIAPLQHAFDIAFRRRLPNPVIVETIRRELGEHPLCLEFAAAFEGSKRGVTPGPEV